MGRRGRRRRDEEGATPVPAAPSTEYADADGDVLELRGALSPASRRRYAETRHGGLDREDALARAAELLFEQLTVSWTIAGVRTERARDLLGRYRMAGAAERTFVRESLRAHVAENFPDLEAP